MKAFFGHAFRHLLVLLFSVSVAFAQTTPPAPPNAAATQPELDQMLAPIALYPDSLLSQILMASTYPLEVVEAARWSRANPGLKGEDAVNAVEQRDWDPSVRSLAAFPQVLAMMDQQIEWTARLGDVFIAQEPQVMETVQNLRQRAYQAGNLRSTEQAFVIQQGDAYAIEPASPEVVYVPYYDPRVVYGSWWWPAYPPVYWAPWPGYYAYPGYVPGFAWGVGITVGTGFFFSHCDWRQRRVTVVNVTNVVVNRTVVVNRPEHGRAARPVVWQHDPTHRRGVPYHIAALQQQFGGGALPGQRRDFRWQGPLAPTTRNGSLNRPEVHEAHVRPRTAVAERPNPRRPETAPAAAPRVEPRPEFRAPVTQLPAPRVEPRPEFRAPVSRPPAPPVAALPQARPVPGNVPRPAPSAPKPQGEGHNR